MAQLSDDCFAFDGPLLPIEEAERLVVSRIAAVAETEAVDLAAACGRVLAADLVSPIDVPPFANSAVDGYAVRHADVAGDGETRLKVVDRLTAGRASEHALGAGEAARVFTGAPMPAGADTVFMQEDVRVEDGAVVVPPGLKRGANARDAGEDVRVGSRALRAGRRIRPSDLALAAALGISRIEVRRRVRVALFSTGDEVVEPGAPLSAGRIHDANRPMLKALLECLGACVTDLGILADEPDGLGDALVMAAGTHDLIVTSGGVSTGEADHVRAAVERIGKLVFWRVAIKPGRPVAMGVVPSLAPETRAAFVGLPGNPVAVFVTFARLVRPLLLRLAGAVPEPLAAYPVRAGFAYKKKKGRREYVRVTLAPGEDGTLEARKHPREGAGIISSLTETNGLGELAEEVTTLAPGETLGFIPYSAIWG